MIVVILGCSDLAHTVIHNYITYYVIQAAEEVVR